MPPNDFRAEYRYRVCRPCSSGDTKPVPSVKVIPSVSSCELSMFVHASTRCGKCGIVAICLFSLLFSVNNGNSGGADVTICNAVLFHKEGFCKIRKRINLEISGVLINGLKKWVRGEGTTKNILIVGLAELIGTAMLVFLGCMGCIAGLGVVPIHLQITVTFGLTVMIVIQCIGHLSQAHINPAVTVGAVILGKKTISEALVYFVSQMVGAVLGYGMLKVVTPKDNLTAGKIDQADMFCVTGLHADLSAIQGLIVEGIATAILMMVVCSVWDPRNEKNTDSIPIRFGFTVIVLATATGPYTGCSLNPARSFAPALWNNQWRHQWIYWFGPIGGALISSFMYKSIFGVPENVEEEEPVPEAIALNCVDPHKTEQS